MRLHHENDLFFEITIIRKMLAPFDPGNKNMLKKMK